MKHPELAERNRTHGLSHTPEYVVWCAMKQRCNYTKNKRFDRYGGRGIAICERWKDFANFYADMGERPEGMSLDRVNSDGDYTPENCRWATCSEQMSNTSRTRKYEMNGFVLSMKQWSEKLGINYWTLRKRLDKGMSIEAATVTAALTSAGA